MKGRTTRRRDAPLNGQEDKSGKQSGARNQDQGSQQTAAMSSEGIGTAPKGGILQGEKEFRIVKPSIE